MKSDSFTKVWEKFNALFARYQSFGDIKAEKIELGEAVVDENNNPVPDGEYILDGVKVTTESSIIKKLEIADDDELEKEAPAPEAPAPEEVKEDVACDAKKSNMACGDKEEMEEAPEEKPKEEAPAPDELEKTAATPTEQQEEGAEKVEEAAPEQTESPISTDETSNVDELKTAIALLTETVKDLNERITKLESLGCEKVKEGFKRQSQASELLRFAFS